MPRLKGPPQAREHLPPRFYSVNEFCDVTGLSRPGAYNGMRRGEIPFVVLTGCRKIPVSFVDELASKAGAPDQS
jgi:hypothetical protein